MRIIHFFLFTLIISKNLFSNNIFETREYELDFSSNNINLIKENKINEIYFKLFCDNVYSTNKIYNQINKE